MYVCNECAKDPPVSYDFCDFACGNLEVSKSNYKLLDTICSKCFSDRQVMEQLCDIGCKTDPVVRYARLCKGCKEHGIN